MGSKWSAVVLLHTPMVYTSASASRRPLPLLASCIEGGSVAIAPDPHWQGAAAVAAARFALLCQCPPTY
jgi:hypothetical protein